MAKKNGRDFIYVVWQDVESRNNYTIGTLTRNGGYEFAYGLELERAKEHGFTPLVSFPYFDKTYHDAVMFPAFACRLPDSTRRDIDTILCKYGLSVYDEFEFLKKSGARLPTDTLFFIDPIFEEEDAVDRSFYVAGVRHYMVCDGDDCSSTPQLVPGLSLVLRPTPDNKHDKNAVQIQTQEGLLLGYLPRYYSETISLRLAHKLDYLCEIVEHACQKPCGECLKVHLRMPAPQFSLVAHKK